VTFTSVEFLFFWPLAFGVYWLLPRRAAWQNGWLLALGYAFYWAWHPGMVPLLAATTLVDYAIGRYLGGERPAGPRRVALWLSVAWNVGLLVYFKYLGFLAVSLDALLTRLGLPGSLPVLQIALPMGISYFTLQKLSYVIDVYDRRLPACPSLPRFATAVAFFPHMVAGPVTRPSALLPQLEVPRGLSAGDVSTGALLFLIGYLEKACIADTFASTLVDPVFARAGAFSAGAHWAAAFGYAIQVFCDFAGYSLMAMGVARGFGLHLPLNFDKPFLSTLGLVVVRRYDEFYRGLCRKDRNWVARRRTRAYKLVVWALTTGFFVLSLIPFRAGNGEALLAFLGGLLPGHGGEPLMLGLFTLLTTVGVGVGVVVVEHLLGLPRFAPLTGRFFTLPAPVRGLVYGVIIIYLGVFVPQTQGLFIYAQF